MQLLFELSSQPLDLLLIGIGDKFITENNLYELYMAKEND